MCLQGCFLGELVNGVVVLSGFLFEGLDVVLAFEEFVLEVGDAVVVVFELLLLFFEVGLQGDDKVCFLVEGCVFLAEFVFVLGEAGGEGVVVMGFGGEGLLQVAELGRHLLDDGVAFCEVVV